MGLVFAVVGFSPATFPLLRGDGEKAPVWVWSSARALAGEGPGMNAEEGLQRWALSRRAGKAPRGRRAGADSLHWRGWERAFLGPVGRLRF